jgi:ABC-2 type transport system ATP-binding protein
MSESSESGSAPPSAPPAAPSIRLRDVEKKFGTARALREVTFTVPRGSLCGLVGPNGAGKTTTMRIIVTDLDATEGNVEVLGCPLPRDAEEVRGRIGYMPDTAGLYEELTLSEYLSFFASFYGLRGESRRNATETAMELAGVTGFAKRRLVGLSKGERQRVLLARTLINDPELLVLDEPADGLDPRGRVELRELLSLLHERGKTILISSHILADLEEICTDLLFIDHGRILFQGSRKRLLEDGLQHARIRIECLSSRDVLLEIVSALPDVILEEETDTGVEIGVPADPQYANELLRHLLDSGVPITSFARRTDSLESVYLRLTETSRETT